MTKTTRNLPLQPDQVYCRHDDDDADDDDDECRHGEERTGGFWVESRQLASSWSASTSKQNLPSVALQLSLASTTSDGPAQLASHWADLSSGVCFEAYIDEGRGRGRQTGAEKSKVVGSLTHHNANARVTRSHERGVKSVLFPFFEILAAVREYTQQLLLILFIMIIIDQYLYYGANP